MFQTWIDAHREEIIARTQEVLRINSVGGPATGPNEPFGPGCAQALEQVLRLGEELGFAVKNVEGYAGHIEFGEGDEYIGVLGHLDVVPVGDAWTKQPFGAEIVDGKIYARGAIDDKGPMMAALFGLKAIKESGVPLGKKVRLIFGLDEESDWRCVQHYFSKEPKPVGGFTPDADFPLIFAEKGLMVMNIIKQREQIDTAPVAVRELKAGHRVNMVPDGCRVRLTVEDDAKEVAALIRDVARQEQVEADVQATDDGAILLFVKGVSAHGAAPFKGANAIVGAAKLLLALDTADRELWQFLADFDWQGERIGLGLTCDVTGPLTANLGLAAIDDERAVLTVNVRYPVDKTLAEIMSMSAERLAPEGYSVEETGDFNMDPHYVPVDSEVVQKLLTVYREETGDLSEPLTTGGGTYARAVPNTVAFGALFPGQEELAHQADENWAVADLLRCTNIYARAIYELAK